MIFEGRTKAGRAMRIRRNESANEKGQVLPLVGLGLVVLLGALSLAVDIGFLRHMQKQMQVAADSAAIAGASELPYGDMYVAAYTDAGSNSFSCSSLPSSSPCTGPGSLSIAVNNPPLSGAYAGDSSSVEVIVSQPQPTFFAKVFGIQSVPLTARAVARVGSSQACIYGLCPTCGPGNGTINVSGGQTCVAAACGIVDEGTTPGSLVVSGGSTLAGASIASSSSSGDVTPSGESACTTPSNTTTTPTYNSPAPSPVDPLTYLTPPPYTAPASCNGSSNSITIDSGTTNPISSGVYCSITVSGNGVSAQFGSGTYILVQGGLTVQGGANVSGSDVTFYNTCYNGQCGSINVTGGSSTNLSAPTSGAYNGILFYQDPINTQGATVSGGSSTVIQGALYFPTAELTFSGGSQLDPLYTTIVAWTVNFSGGSYINSDYTTLPSGQPIKSASLVE